MPLSVVTDFTMSHDGEMLTSDNRHISSFVMRGETTIESCAPQHPPSLVPRHECAHQDSLRFGSNNGRSDPLSPTELDHFESLAKASPTRTKEPATDTGFVLVRKGSMDASVDPLSPSDRKLYYKRQSFSSPKVLPQVRECAVPNVSTSLPTM